MKIILSALMLISFQALAKPPVIYGEDNRKDPFESRDSMLVELSKSTAAMIEPANLKARNGVVEITSKSLESRGVCEKERFSHQMSAALCSGFLVSENILVTAGHCIKSEADCRSYKWVFDYKVESATDTDISVPASSVFSCKKIISRQLSGVTKDDYAVIELDRSVSDRRPMSFRRSGKPAKGDSIAVIGYPTGLPLKITDGATIRSLSSKFFVANLDTYQGNSGSAVVSTKTGEVEGILVRGENDWNYDSELGCQVSNICSESGCRGEDVTYITNVESILKL